MHAFSFLPLADALALAWFFFSWAGYAWYSARQSTRGMTLLAVTNGWRKTWMLQATSRDPRMLDGLIVQGLSTSPSFFASTSIIIIGGLLALLGTTDRAVELVREIPFAAQTTVVLFELKMLLLAGIFVFAFFRFSWSIRQYTFAALMVGSMPPPADFANGRVDREAYAERAGTLVGLAAETFNDGIRAYYFAFAAVAWFFSVWAFAIASASVVAVLWGREFHSNVLAVLRNRA